MMSKRFTEPVDTYTVLILNLDDYCGTARELPDGFHFIDEQTRATMRAQEKKILQQLFDDWDIPYFGKLRGWRADSPIFVAKGDELIGGAFLCDRNEFDDNILHGQLHYLFTKASARGQGIYTLVFRQAVERARDWGLQALYVNTDRYGIPQVHLRWGAKIVKVIPKPSRLPQNRVGRILQTLYAPVRRLRWYVRRIRGSL